MPGGMRWPRGRFAPSTMRPARPGRTREAAFALLAADALMTEAVDRLIAGEDPGARMRELVERLTRGGSPVER